MSQKVVRPAPASRASVARDGRHNGGVGTSLGFPQSPPAQRRSVIDRLRKQIECLERQTSVRGFARGNGSSRLPTPRAYAQNQASLQHAQDGHEVRGEPDAQGDHNVHGGQPAPLSFALLNSAACSHASPAPSPHLPAAIDRQDGIFNAQWTLNNDAAGLSPEHTHDGRSRRSTAMAWATLDDTSVHEIKPALYAFDRSMPLDWIASWSAAYRFCLALIARRLVGLNNVNVAAITQLRKSNSGHGSSSLRERVLWCQSRATTLEYGSLYLHGLPAFGLTSEDLVMVETSRDPDTLWALEEGLKSNGLALVFGIIDDADLTSARRLALAAKAHNTPCLLLTHPRSPPAAATATRWRVAAQPSASLATAIAHNKPPSRNQTLGCISEWAPGWIAEQDPILPPEQAPKQIPGRHRFAVTLERHQAAPQSTLAGQTIMEWSNETFCLDLVTEFRHRSHSPKPTEVRSGKHV